MLSGCEPNFDSIGIWRVSAAHSESMVWMRNRAGLSLMRQPRAREFVRAPLVLGPALPARDHPRKRLEHALAHFGCGFPGEGDGDDLLGLVHRRQKAEIALDQEFGLARAGRRLDDERARRRQRLLAR